MSVATDSSAKRRGFKVVVVAAEDLRMIDSGWNMEGLDDLGVLDVELVDDCIRDRLALGFSGTLVFVSLSAVDTKLLVDMVLGSAFVRETVGAQEAFSVKTLPFLGGSTVEQL